MTFRAKLFLIFTLALLLTVGLIAAGVPEVTRRAYDQLSSQYSNAIVAQFQREFAAPRTGSRPPRRGHCRRGGTVRMAIDLSRPQADVSVYVNDARGVSQSHQLDFLDFVASDGSIISSAEWSARFGYKIGLGDAAGGLGVAVGSFLTKVDTQEGPRSADGRLDSPGRRQRISTSWAARGWAMSFSLRSCFPPGCARFCIRTSTPTSSPATWSTPPARRSKRTGSLPSSSRSASTERADLQDRLDAGSGERGGISRRCRCSAGRKNCSACC